MLSQLATSKIHFGMAQYADNPIELWYSYVWGLSITTVSGQYVYS
jgi:hypothetical protein